MAGEHLRQTVTISDAHGFHMRPMQAFVEAANQFLELCPTVFADVFKNRHGILPSFPFEFIAKASAATPRDAFFRTLKSACATEWPGSEDHASLTSANPLNFASSRIRSMITNTMQVPSMGRIITI